MKTAWKPLSSSEKRRFHALVVKDALGTATIQERAELEKLQDRRTSPKEKAHYRRQADKCNRPINKILKKLGLPTL